MENIISEIPIFSQLVDISKDRFQAYCQHGGDVTTEMVNNDYGLLAPWTSLILVSGNDYRITFKVHFPVINCKGLVAQSGAESDDLQNELKIKMQVFDYLKEFCNYYAGSLKRAFSDANVNMGISLPILTRGFDEVFFPRANFNSSFEVYWKMKNSIAEFKCSLFLEATNVEKLKSLSIKLDSSDEGEIEFL